MRPCSAALAAFLDNPQFLQCVQLDLYTFVLNGGETYRYTSGASAITVPAVGFPTGSINVGADRTFSVGPGFKRSKAINKVGVEATELDIDIIAGASDLISSTFTFANAVRLGLFDDATVELDRFFARDVGDAGEPDTSLGTLLWFYGKVSTCDMDRTSIHMKVKSLINLLSIQQMPKRLFQAACNHVFGGPMCGYDPILGKNALGVSTGIGQATVAADTGTSQGVLVCTATPPNYVQGTCIGVTGKNAGFTRTISAVSGNNLGFFKAWIYPIAVGDTFHVRPGCDHTTARCNNDLQNILRFGGFPFIPPPENAV
jgi:hypothetical protein